MTQARLSLALPDASFEKFPTKLSANDAASLLRCWTSTWHPAVLAELGSRPDIWSVEDDEQTWPADGLASSVVVVPTFVRPAFSAAVGAARAAELACFDQPGITRHELIADLCGRLNVELGEAEDGGDPNELVGDFFALAYGWLQVRLMTLHVRYSSNMDDQVFDAELVAAASAWVKSRFDEASAKLTRCFDLLLEEKNSYYSVEPQLIDLVLLEPTTLSASLDGQLKSDHHLNLLLTGDVAQQLLQRNGAAAETIRTRMMEGAATVVGGWQYELPSSLLPIESHLRQFRLGAATFESVFGSRPRVFARRRFGLTSMTPGLLEQLGYAGALHLTLDGGQVPDVNASNMRWMGEDAQSIPGLATVPVDADDSSRFLSLGIAIAKQLDAEHASSNVFAHWPGGGCDSFRDLQRLTRHGALFGDFIGANDYFDSAYDPGYGDTLTAEQYESPLRPRQMQGDEPNALSRYVDGWQSYQQLASCRSLVTMVSVLKPVDDAAFVAKLSHWLKAIDSLEQSVDLACFRGSDASHAASEVAKIEQQVLRSEVNELGDTIAREFVECLSSEQAAETTTLAINPLSHSVIGDPCGGGPLQLPATGWHAAIGGSSQKASLSGPPVDDGLTLRNEFFQIEVDPGSGGIRSLQTYQQRQTQISQRLSVCMPGEKRMIGGKQRLKYATMIADDVATHRISSSAAKIVSSGWLADPDSEATLCRFTQTLIVRRQDRVADVRIELHDLGAFAGDVDHYVCSRLAWRDETALLHYGAAELRSDSTLPWLDAPSYVRVEQPDYSATLLTGGLPWHRRSGRNRLDTVLVAGNEQRREFRLGLVSDCPDDLSASMSWLVPPVEIASQSQIQPAEGWLFHFGSKHVVSLFSEPMLDGSRVAGVRFRLFETQGRRGKLRLTCPFEIDRAERMMFDGRGLGALECEGRVAHVDFSRNEYFEVHLFRSL